MAVYDGYVYAMTNEAMVGYVKIGMTERNPTLRLKEANKPDTFKPPLPYKFAFVKRVFDCKNKEKKIHTILSTFTKRVTNNREFFEAPLEQVKMIFAKMMVSMMHNLLVLIHFK
jgi:hypothetical protein